MQSPYQTQIFFISILPENKIDYEEEYHEASIDPDGKIRYLLQ
jgi:hypothetical protein